ncbi:MAG: MFS transporter [Bacteroidia bacterium]|nr:MFS transporter [Bacteroidia bacterium]
MSEVKGNKRIITAWTFFDWANSSYPLVITAALFPIFYENLTKDGAGDTVWVFGMEFKNTAIYTLALAAANLITAILAPLLSGVADYSGRKKGFLMIFTYIGALACAGLYFFSASNITLGLATVMLANIGFNGGLVFYNAFLPEIAAPEQQDRVSARGFSMGYFGSAILLILNLVYVMSAEESEQLDALRWSFVSVGVWWIGFAQIPFALLPGNLYNRSPSGNYLLNGYRELMKVRKQLLKHKYLAKFLSAFFVYNMGVQTVMLVATLFGSKVLNLSSSQLITTILILQFVAIIGAVGFSRLSAVKGNVFTLSAAVLIWILVCVAAYFVSSAVQFYVVAGLVGFVMGGIQAMSRSTYSKLLPDTEDHASFFSFFDVTDKLCTVCGMAVFALIEQFWDMRSAVLALILFFVVGFLLLLRVSMSKNQ